MRVVGWSVGAAALAVAVSSSAAFAQSNPMFGVARVQLEGVILQRGDLGGAPLTVPLSPGAYDLVKYSDLDPETGGGLRLKLDGWLFGQRTVYSVLGAWGFDASLLRRGMDVGSGNTDAAYVPGSTVDTSNSAELDGLSAKFKSSLITTDSASYIFGGSPDRPGFSFIAGTRSFILDESLKTVAYDEGSDYPSGTFIDRVKVDVKNWATGLQIGVEGYTPIAQGFTVGGFIKGGLLANFVDVDSKFSSDINSLARLNKSYDSVEFAQFVELSGRVSYQISPNLELTGSAMLLYLNGIAEAGGQYSSVATSSRRNIDADSDALFYGGTLGLTYKFN